MWEDFKHVLKEKHLFAKTLYSPNSLLSLSSFAFYSFALSSLFWVQFFQHCTPFPHCDPCIPFSSWWMQGQCSLRSPHCSPRPAGEMWAGVYLGVGRHQTAQLLLTGLSWTLPVCISPSWAGYHTQLPLKPISIPLQLKCWLVHRAWISRWL